MNPVISASPGGGVWAEIAGQSAVISILQEAGRSARQILETRKENFQAKNQNYDSDQGSDQNQAQNSATTDTNANITDKTGPAATSHAMSQSWLIVGPPGSGRSVAGRAFAAALQCSGPQPGCGSCEECRSVMQGSHPDVLSLVTDRVSISKDQIRELLPVAYSRPSRGKWRVIIVEDYDRIDEASSNLLLKPIEEPPLQTVWLLCAPSAVDVMETIRSRCRLLTLRTPSLESVAELLVRRNGIDPKLASQVAAESGGHVGLARALATEPGVREARNHVITLAAGARTIPDAVWAAEAIVRIAKEQDKEACERLDAKEYEQLRISLGIAEDVKRLPAVYSAQLRTLEENQKRRARRSWMDVLDRNLQNLASFYRDVLMEQLQTGLPLCNAALAPLVSQVARESESQTTIARLEAITQAGRRIKANVSPNLALEALCVQLSQQGSVLTTLPIG